MKAGKKPDKIDLELSKTYFGKRSTQAEPEKKGKTPGKRKSFRPSALLAGIALMAGIMLVLLFRWPSPGTERSSAPPRKEGPGKKTFSSVSKAPKAVTPDPELSAEKHKRLYDFENNDNGWEIPSWELEKQDHVARSFKNTRAASSTGSGSMELVAEFPGGSWAGALVEIQQFLDLGKYDRISADIYLPPECPSGLRGKLILTVGEKWKFVEMARSARLAPGEWTTITASISDGSMDWKRTVVDEAFRSDVRKIAIRIESNGKPAYSGPVLIDNIRVYSLDQ